MSTKVSISVDSKEFEAEKDELLIDFLLDNEIEIPHFCYHKSLGVDGNCRMCMVEIEGSKRPQIACNTPIKEGMNIKTKGEMIQKVRKDILELELINHPIDCPVCDQAGECKLQDYYMDSGLYDTRMDVSKNLGDKHTDLGKNVMLDQERCVMCTRCVRFTQDITKSNELGVGYRADHAVITTFPGTKLQDDYSMNVVDLCPVGALTNKDFRFNQRVWFLKSFDSICYGCSKGCNVFVDHAKEKYKDDTIFRLRPRHNEKVNGYFMCDTGRLSYKQENDNRLYSANIFDKESSKQETLETIISHIADKKNKSFILISPMLSLEEMQSIKQLANEYNIPLSGYSEHYIDDSFKDNMLKTNDKSPNRKALDELEIEQSSTYFMENLKKANCIIICENNYFTNTSNTMQDKILINFSSIQSDSNKLMEINYPISSFWEKNGTYINHEGIHQKNISKLNKNEPLEDLSQIFTKIKTNLKLQKK